MKKIEIEYKDDIKQVINFCLKTQKREVVAFQRSSIRSDKKGKVHYNRQ